MSCKAKALQVPAHGGLWWYCLGGCRNVHGCWPLHGVLWQPPGFTHFSHPPDPTAGSYPFPCAAVVLRVQLLPFTLGALTVCFYRLNDFFFVVGVFFVCFWVFWGCLFFLFLLSLNDCKCRRWSAVCAVCINVVYKNILCWGWSGMLPCLPASHGYRVLCWLSTVSLGMLLLAEK